MNKTLGLLLDSSRELNSKRLFWITLILSGVVVVGMACIGLQDGRLTLLGWQSDVPGDNGMFSVTDSAMLYKKMYSYIGVGFWLSFIGTVLGLVSTAGIFPDFLVSGSVDLYLSKPISRLRLFLTKYFGGLLFVTLQMTVFAAASFLLLGLRAHSWEPAIFLSIPLVVLMFSYLFGFCTLLGVITRSTIASLMLTILFWCILWGVQFGIWFDLRIVVTQELFWGHQDKELARDKRLMQILPETLPATTAPSVEFRTRGAGDAEMRELQTEPQTRPEMQSKIDRLESEKSERAATAQNVLLILKCVLAPLPKTTMTTDLLDRELASRAGLVSDKSGDNDDAFSPGSFAKEFEAEVDRRTQSVPGWYIIGTSLAFEVAVLAVAAWIFQRRDY